MAITVFVNETCGYCKEQKEFMKEQGIDYIEKNINESKGIFSEFQELGGVAIPYTVKTENGEVLKTVTGFHKEHLLEVIK